MLQNMLRGAITPDQAMQWAEWFWVALAAVWLAMAVAVKTVKRRETALERAQHLVPLLIGFWLIFGQTQSFPWLHLRLLPNVAAVWWLGLLLTAVGVGISIWARLSLGSNWSGTVTLKDAHELVRKGLYKYVRHPIYTGLLVAAVGSGMIHGQLRDLLGFLVLYATFYFKARREEFFLSQEFGPGFADHYRNTGMFLPKLI